MPSQEKDSILDSLNDEQRRAVTHPGGPLLILAGAGSGKTRVLTHRVAWLIRQEGVSPDRILAVTFTNKAAGEMRERIAGLLGLPVRGLWIGTFHSVCLRLLRSHAREAGFEEGLSVFDREDQLGLLKRTMKDLGLDASMQRVRDMAALIGRAKNEAKDADAYEAEADTPARRQVAKVFRAYQDALRQQNAADFDDLLLLAYRMLSRNEALADAYSRHFMHVLVDEYQDTNHVQFRIVELLARRHRNIFVVGDDDQSIYGWRGADVRNILEFKEHFPEATVIRLEQNYRSTPQILAIANAAISANKRRWTKRLWTRRPGGDLPAVFVAVDEDEEAEEVTRRIQAAVSSGRFRYRDIAVFYRTHAQSRPLEDALLRAGVPYVVVGGIYFYQRKEVKDLLAYLRVLVNPKDATSLARALGVPRRGVGEQSIARLLEEARRSGRDPLEIAAGSPPEAIRGKARRALMEFASFMLELRRRVSEPPERILGEILERIDYVSHLKDTAPDWEERAENVVELLESARQFSATSGGGVREYMDTVSLLSEIDTVELGSDAVSLMTAHNAKGLEFGCVFVVGLEEGLFPHASSLYDEAELEEERRLFYVACTRAKERLVLSASTIRRRLSSSYGGVSRFLLELPEDLYEETPVGGDASEEGSSDSVSRMDVWRGGPDGPGGWRDDPFENPLVGRRVFHESFGAGIVVEADGVGEGAKVVVSFNSGERKKLIARFLEWE